MHDICDIFPLPELSQRGVAQHLLKISGVSRASIIRHSTECEAGHDPIHSNAERSELPSENLSKLVLCCFGQAVATASGMTIRAATEETLITLAPLRMNGTSDLTRK